MLLQLFLGSSIHPSPQETAGVWLDVPYVKQTEDGCGSAAISMLLQYWNSHGGGVESRRADFAAVQKKHYFRKNRGIRAFRMGSYFKGVGFRVFPLQGGLKEPPWPIQQG